MSANNEPVEKDPAALTHTDLLDRLLEAVEKPRRKHLLEVVTATVLALGMLGSAWCAYQSTLWSGVQRSYLNAAIATGRERAEADMEVLQGRVFDASMLIDYMRARSQKNRELEKFLFDRFRPEMKKAVEAWLQTDPFNDPRAPSSPLRLAHYGEKEREQARHLGELSAGQHAAAHQAGESVHHYVLVSVLFTSVLALGGLSGTFESRWLHRTLASLAIILFIAASGALATLPICRERPANAPAGLGAVHQESVKAGKTLVEAHGSTDEVKKAEPILAATSPAALNLHGQVA